MTTTEMTFSKVEAKLAKPSNFRHIIGDVFKAKDDECWKECRPYLMPPGIDGSTQFDHCEVINILLKHDKLMSGQIASYMIANGISKAALWKSVANCIKCAGFDIQHGRVLGLLENENTG